MSDLTQWAMVTQSIKILQGGFLVSTRTGTRIVHCTLHTTGQLGHYTPPYPHHICNPDLDLPREPTWL